MKAVIYLAVCFSFIFSSAQEFGRLIIYFNFDKYTLESASKTQIDSLLKNLNIERIELSGHCDSFGNETYNDILSLKRALEVKQYMLTKEFKGSQITTKAFGKRAPLNNNGNKNARSLNRRVEILVFIKGPILINTESKEEEGMIIKNLSSPIFDTLTSFNIDNLKIGSTFKLENMNFLGGTHLLLPNSYKTLEHLFNFLKANPTIEIEIQGHICCQESGDARDLDGTPNLSLNRAKAIYNYLVKKGIKRARLSFKGLGANNKLVEEETEEDQATNRRVEIKIIKK